MLHENNVVSKNVSKTQHLWAQEPGQERRIVAHLAQMLYQVISVKPAHLQDDFLPDVNSHSGIIGRPIGKVIRLTQFSGQKNRPPDLSVACLSERQGEKWVRSHRFPPAGPAPAGLGCSRESGRGSGGTGRDASQRVAWPAVRRRRLGCESRRRDGIGQQFAIGRGAALLRTEEFGWHGRRFFRPCLIAGRPNIRSETGGAH